MKSIVVTGVSSGIGRNIAKTLVSNGFRVFGSVRKPSDAKAEAAGAAVGTGLGAFFLLILWVMGDIILGLLYLVARPSKR